jgi:hypothetical protein
VARFLARNPEFVLMPKSNRLWFHAGFVTYLHGMQICYDRHTANHLGYAISHFDHPAAAQYAIATLHNFKLHGRHIVVAPYRPKRKDACALHACPPQFSPPAANEAVALVINLSENATWMYGPFM